MNDATFFSLIIVFSIGIIINVILTIRSSRSWLVWLSPLAIVGSIIVGYFGIDHVIGSPKPVDRFPMWGAPELAGDGAKVVGGSLIDDTAYLMLEESSDRVPRLYGIHMDEKMKKGMRDAMKSQAEHQKGNPWGFRMTKGGARGQKDGQGDGDKAGNANGQKGGKGKGNGEGIAIQDDTPYLFGDPQPKKYKDKSPELGETPNYQTFGG